MSPSLLVDDNIAVDTRSYEQREPSRGDVVVFYSPRTDNFWVKRLVGLPGDRIQLVGDILYINGEPVDQESLDEDCVEIGSSGSAAPVSCLRETLPGGASYVILDLTSDPGFGDTESRVVPAGHYYVLGDNRDNSTDSRVSVIGNVPRKHLMGKAIWVYWSSNLSRIGTSLE